MTEPTASRPPFEISVSLLNFSTTAPGRAWSALIDQARVADAAGVDRLIVVDHVVMGEHIEAYDGGPFPTPPGGDWLEPLTTLSVIAGATSRIRLSTGILIAALRPPAVLAKTAATLDVLSGGRLDLGVGVGWQREEYEAVGLDFAERGDLLDENLRVCRALWAGGPVDWESPRLSFSGTWCHPTPLQPGGIPIWVSGRTNPRTLRRIVELGAGWIPWAEQRDDVADGVREIRAALAAAGRDPDAFGVRGRLPVVAGADGRPDVAATMRAVPGLVAAGVTDFQLGVALSTDGDAPQQLAELVGGFRSAVM